MEKFTLGHISHISHNKKYSVYCLILEVNDKDNHQLSLMWVNKLSHNLLILYIIQLLVTSPTLDLTTKVQTDISKVFSRNVIQLSANVAIDHTSLLLIRVLCVDTLCHFTLWMRHNFLRSKACLIWFRLYIYCGFSGLADLQHGTISKWAPQHHSGWPCPTYW